MKSIALLPVFLALLLASCATYDPDFQREYKLVQNVEYPPEKLVGRWLQVGYSPASSAGVIEEHRVYDMYFANGTGMRQSVQSIPPIYEQYRDLFAGNPDFKGEMITETTLTWKYLGMNKWEIRQNSDFRVVSQPSWILSTNPKAAPPAVVRYHNNKIFFPTTHSSAVFIASDADAAAKLARLRAAVSPKMVNYLQIRRANQNRVRAMQQNMMRSMYAQPQPAMGYGPMYQSY